MRLRSGQGRNERMRRGCEDVAIQARGNLCRKRGRFVLVFAFTSLLSGSNEEERSIAAIRAEPRFKFLSVTSNC
jgi:hypothetical protein